MKWFETRIRNERDCIISWLRQFRIQFARQLLAQGKQVIAAVRHTETAAQLWQLAANSPTLRPQACIIEECDVTSERSVDEFIARIRRLVIERGGTIDTIVLNAGILRYEKGLGSLQVSYQELMGHLGANCAGNVVVARRVLMLNEEIRTNTAVDTNLPVNGRNVVFMSSDSGSMGDFRDYEVGFAAYGASKVALNMMIRHLALELRKRAEKAVIGKAETPSWEGQVCVLAMHPGEVATDMQNITVDWEVEGVIPPAESVSKMLAVINERGPVDSGTFWRWDGTVSVYTPQSSAEITDQV